MKSKNLKKKEIKKKSQNPLKDMIQEDKMIGVKVPILKKHLLKTTKKKKTLQTMRNPKRKSIKRVKDNTKRKKKK
jgi:hypothetical protein